MHASHCVFEPMDTRPLLPREGRTYAGLRKCEADEYAPEPAPLALAAELARLAHGAEEVIQDYLADDTVVWGTFDREPLVGTLAVSRRFSKQVGWYLWLWGLYVRPPYRGTPVSGELINGVLAWCHFQPPEQRVFGVLEPGNLRAQWFCERHGLLPVDDAALKFGLRLSPDEILVERPRGC